MSKTADTPYGDKVTVPIVEGGGGGLPSNSTLDSIAATNPTAAGVDMNGQKLQNMANPLGAFDAATKHYVDTTTLPLTSTLDSIATAHPTAAAVDMNGNAINNVTDPVAVQDAATKAYADTKAPLHSTTGVSIIDNSAGLPGLILEEDGAADLTLSANGTGRINIQSSSVLGTIVKATGGPLLLTGNNGTGTIKVGNGIAEKIGFWGAAPVVQKAVIAAPAGGVVIDVEARAAIQAILNVLGAAAGGVGITA